MSCELTAGTPLAGRLLKQLPFPCLTERVPDKRGLVAIRKPIRNDAVRFATAAGMCLHIAGSDLGIEVVRFSLSPSFGPERCRLHPVSGEPLFPSPLLASVFVRD